MRRPGHRRSRPCRGCERGRPVSASLLAVLERGTGIEARVMLIVAHPDDEVIGAGGLLPRLQDGRLVYLTDGAPADMGDAARLGFVSRAAYARAREREAEAALTLAGIGPERVRRLGFGDQETSLRLRAAVQAVLEQFRAWRPAAVLTHPFENGHPDHDAAAFAVHLACRMLRAGGEPVPSVIEFASYHAAEDGRMVVQTFLPAAVPAVTLRLDEAGQALKRRMLACHATQAAMLDRFPVDRECYRQAPDYDFLQPPHPWRPLYERWFTTMTRERWQALAAEALAACGAAPRC